MSKDMSVFKKMKERITDEVNSKLHSMQIIDQLTSSIGQQMVTRNDVPPDQLLPDPRDPSSFHNHQISSHFSTPSNPSGSGSNSNSSSKILVNNFSLTKDGHVVSGLNEEDELNSDLSPLHQLFNENSILRLNEDGSLSNNMITTTTQTITDKTKNNGTTSINKASNFTKLPLSAHQNNETQSVISNLDNLSSDIDEAQDDDDVEIDLLSDKPELSKIIDTGDDAHNSISNKNQITRYKTKYKNLVHAIRIMNQDFNQEKTKLEIHRNELTNQITALKLEMESKSNNQQHDSLISVSTNVSTERDDKSGTGSPQPTTKASQKLKDLERLLAKCKESLKLKNKQIQTLKDSLCEVEKFKDSNQELRNELAELREAHETWTLSIAENKRVMHQEIENKNLQIDKMKNETKDLQSNINESNNRVKQLKASIQDLESRLVSTSAAHQKERESLIKELNLSKNNAIKKAQQENEIKLEKVKLELEFAIEALKSEILGKDQQIIRSAQAQEQAEERQKSMSKQLEENVKLLETQTKELKEIRVKLEESENKNRSLNEELDKMKLSCASVKQLQTKTDELNLRIEELTIELSDTETAKKVLEEKLENYIHVSELKPCKVCPTLKHTIQTNKEKFQQQLHELNTQLTVMTNANDDQEKEISTLKSDKNKMNDSFKKLKEDFDELTNKNESLNRIIQDNEADIQTQQEQLDRLSFVDKQLDVLKKENTTLLDKLTQYKGDLEDRNNELTQVKTRCTELVDQLDKIKSDLAETNKSIDKEKFEKSDLLTRNEKLAKQIRSLTEQIVVRVLATMKNLETPNTSPGSDKSFGTNKLSSSSDNELERELPDPIKLMEDLSSIALDRCNSYVTTNQRLQAVLLDNTIMGDEIRQLKENLSNLNEEKSLQAQCSIDETEKLQTENQALIHDQQMYEDKIKSLEEELRTYKEHLIEAQNAQKESTDAIQSLMSEKDHLLVKLAKVEEEKNKVPEEVTVIREEPPKQPPINEHDFQNTTEFEYLQNIVYQFMLGKQPLVLARVISAVLKFDKTQIEQISKVQESVQSAFPNGV